MLPPATAGGLPGSLATVPFSKKETGAEGDALLLVESFAAPLSASLSDPPLPDWYPRGLSGRRVPLLFLKELFPVSQRYTLDSL